MAPVLPGTTRLNCRQMPWHRALRRNPWPQCFRRIRMSALRSLSLVKICAALLLAVTAFALADPASAAPPEVRPPSEVRTAPAQFVVVAVANPVTGRPAAVG